MFKKTYENKCLKKIQSEIDKKMIELDLLKIENGKKIYKTGSCYTLWTITKDMMKEKYNIDWKSPQDEHPDWNFD